MNWQTIFILAVLISGLMILWLRIESRIRAPVIIIIYVPSILLILKWTQFRETWMELGIGALIGVAIFLFWWILHGRKLPPPKGSQIIVITDNDDEK